MNSAKHMRTCPVKVAFLYWQEAQGVYERQGADHWVNADLTSDSAMRGHLADTLFHEGFATEVMGLTFQRLPTGHIRIDSNGERFALALIVAYPPAPHDPWSGKPPPAEEWCADPTCPTCFKS